ncbi:DNA uptake lipoprotein [Candidatus Blochmanniella floridana]|uniref:Outer membrane protein assembly factor BamD n=1 Tax=Blochmanniella floridana TaxID=203907 RepID=Q7VQF4_BLOFL|nr:DNA uptake lipoprotein [Candidatus Blochmannia floridanus]
MRILFYIILALNMIMTISCTTISHHKIPDQDTNHLYKIAYNKLLQNNYTEAIQDLLYLKNLYLFEPCPQQIYLDLIYAYYKSNDLTSANNCINHFLNVYPNHKNLDYVLYIHGIINMHLDRNNPFPLLIKHLYTCWFNHNPIHANIAFHSFSKLIQNYPNSQYAPDSYKRLIFLKNRIAYYKLAIIKFYDKKNAYISVITRSEEMLRYFPDTQATYQALHYMRRAYQNIHLIDQANIINQIITENQ